MAQSHKTVVLITGATGVIGNAIARALAATPDYALVLLARDEGRATKAVDAIRRDTGNGDVGYVIADVSRRDSIQALADSWQGPLHVLVNDAGVAPQRRETTAEGIELTFATNVLAYLWMAQAFAPHLEGSAPARIVNVASYWAGDLDMHDLEFQRRRFDNHTAYRQSKQANRMLTVAYGRSHGEARHQHKCLPSRRSVVRAEPQPGLRRIPKPRRRRQHPGNARPR